MVQLARDGGHRCDPVVFAFEQALEARPDLSIAVTAQGLGGVDGEGREHQVPVPRTRTLTKSTDATVVADVNSDLTCQAGPASPQPDRALARAQREIRDELVDQFEGGRVVLPLLSESVQRVLSALSDDRTDARALAEIIKRDQAFAGHVLRVVNSPIYASTSPTVSLQQAVSRLGMGRVREVALLISMQARVFAVAGFAVELNAIFRHAIATALFAQEIARSRRRNVEEGFLSGLLHDVGKPVVLQAIVDSKRPAARELRADRAAVWALVDDLHGLAGRVLAAAWSLPDAIGDLIAGHHDVHARTPSAHVTRLADSLAHFTLGDGTLDEHDLQSHPDAAELNLYPEDLDAFLARRQAIVGAAGVFT